MRFPPLTDDELAARSDAGPLRGDRLHICWIMPFWPTVSNPTACTPARETAYLLARAGHRVAVLGMSDEPPDATLRPHPNLHEDPVVEPGDGPKRQALGAVEILRRARALHREDPFDLVYVRFAHPIGVTAAIVAGVLGVPLIYQEEAPDLPLVTQRRIEKISMTTMKRRAAICMADGPAMAQDVAEYLDRPAYPIPLAVDVDRFDSPDRPSPGPDGVVKLVAVGRVHEQKGTTTLLDAMALLPERFRLDYVGDGTGRADAEAQAARLGIAERVTFHGFKPPGEVPAALAEAHIFVLPSTVESFCLAAAEALVAGLPAVVTRCGGPEYFVGPGDGRVVEIRDHEALAAAIADVASRWDDFDTVDIAERARARFGPLGTLGHYEALFAYVLGRAPMPPAGPFGPFWFG